MRQTLSLFILLFFSITSTKLYSQYNYRSPLDIPISLSANFGELRANHFHTGLDFKTQAVINKNVYAIEDGYIARIGINAGGYGLVLYINHPNGQTSIYAHLNSFAVKTAKYAKGKQYEEERYALDIREIEPHVLPVKRGEVIAKSGNSGSSGGPHVHFELRDTKTQITIDPLPHYLSQVLDNMVPEIRGIAVYPIEDKGVVNNSLNPYRENIVPLKNGVVPSLNKKIEAWGKIGIGIYSVDKMNDTHNIYGVKEVKVFCNDNLIFHSDISSISFSNTRMINSLTDFDYWKYNKRFYMKSFIEPGNKLQIYDRTIGDGYIYINEEKTYTIRYELVDVHGNATTYRLAIEGKNREIPKQEPCSLVMHWDRNNRYVNDHFYLTIPANYLYADANFILNRENSSSYFSEIYKVNNTYIPLHDYVDMSLKLLIDTLVDKREYGIITIDEKGKEAWVGGTYSEDGYLNTQIRELGNTYAISSDTEKPTIVPVRSNFWEREKKIVLRLNDNLSGVKIFRGTIDGEFALFQHDIKSSLYTYYFDAEKLEIGKNHVLKFTVEDAAGNSSFLEHSFKY